MSILASLRSLGDHAIASLQHRVELFTLELQEERTRIIGIFISLSVAIFAGTMTVTFASLTLVYLCWDRARLAVLGGLTIAYAIALVAVVLVIRRQLARHGGAFAATLEELAADRKALAGTP